jgi:hypothetical protein
LKNHIVENLNEHGRDFYGFYPEAPAIFMGCGDRSRHGSGQHDSPQLKKEVKLELFFCKNDKTD